MTVAEDEFETSILGPVAGNWNQGPLPIEEKKQNLNRFPREPQRSRVFGEEGKGTEGWRGIDLSEK